MNLPRRPAAASKKTVTGGSPEATRTALLQSAAQQLAAAQAQSADLQTGRREPEVAVVRAQLAQAQWRLDEKTLRAGQDALVYDTLYRVGEWVPVGSPVVRLLPPGNVKVRFFMPETVVGRLHAGQSVRLQCDGCAREGAATMRYVASEAEYTPPVICSNETRDKLVFMVEAWPPVAGAGPLHPGQPLTVTLP